MNATWADIQRLAADFQRIQLAESSKNIILAEVTVKLSGAGIYRITIDILFTTDGKEYVTRNHLLDEVKNECIFREGRVSLYDLAHTLNVDYEHIESAVDYIDVLCKDLNERLMDNGIVSISQLMKIWNLPTEMLNSLVLVEVGSKVGAIRDGDALYTRSYLSAQRNIIRAMLCGLTKVTPIVRLQSELELTNAMFWLLFDELDAMNEVPGKIVGARTSNHSLYIPNIYTVLVKQYIRKTFLQEGMLSNMNSSSVVDVRLHMPEIVQNNADIDQAIAFLMKNSKDWLFVAGTSYIYCRQLHSVAMRALDGLINARAEEIAVNWGKQKPFKKQTKKQDEDWAAAKGKKNKNGKEKVVKQILAEESTPDIRGIDQGIKKSDLPNELLEDIVEQIRTKAEILLRTRIELLLHNMRTVSVQDEKRTHAKLRETLCALYNNICIFEDGAATFEDTVAASLKIYLLRTVCTHFANNVLSYISRAQNVDTLTTKVRDEIIANIGNTENRIAIEKLFTSLSTKNLESFHDAVLGVCSSAICALNLKMPDKKQRMELIKTYEEQLVSQLRECTDPPSGLLVTLLILLARNEKIAVHASGKFVSHLIAKVEKHPETSTELAELLTSFQKMVISSMRSKEDINLMAKLNEKLVALIAAINGFEYAEKPIVNGGLLEL
ncbi:E3 ufm1-protein ligase 1-like protein [Dirofilaria immitis]|nr:E3 ufm1-protein ligase 1-like protein [Dirofilaria immitis]